MLAAAIACAIEAILAAPSEQIMFVAIFAVVVGLGVHEVHSKGLVQAVREREKEVKTD